MVGVVEAVRPHVKLNEEDSVVEEDVGGKNSNNDSDEARLIRIVWVVWCDSGLNITVITLTQCKMGQLHLFEYMHNPDDAQKHK